MAVREGWESPLLAPLSAGWRPWLAAIWRQGSPPLSPPEGVRLLQLLPRRGEAPWCGHGPPVPFLCCTECGEGQAAALCLRWLPAGWGEQQVLLVSQPSPGFSLPLRGLLCPEFSILFCIIVFLKCWQCFF